MDKKNIPSILKDALEEEIPSSQVHLWQTVKAHLVAGRKMNQQGETMNTSHPRSMSRLVVAVIAAVTLLAVTLVTPQGRAFAQSVLQFFKRAESNVLILPTEQIASPEKAQSISTAESPAPLTSVPEAETVAGFDAKELPSVPQGFVFAGAIADKNRISIQYQAQGGGGQLLINESTTGFMQSEWDQAPVEAISQVKVGQLDAELVQGMYVVYPGETVGRWNPDAPILRLRWISDGIWIEMAKFGDVERIEYLDQNVLIELAASLTNAPFTLAVNEAESLAGFDVLEPTWIPEVLSFRGAAFESALWQRKENTVRIFYSLNIPGLESNGIVLTQQPVRLIEDCEICDLVGAGAEVENVQIGDTTGEYVIGVWSADNNGKWHWEHEPYLQTLRWQANGIAFEILYMGPPEEVIKEDLVAMAEGLK
jgi:hypothetical protein